MFAKVYNLKFPSMDEAKVAASYISDSFGKLIVDCNSESVEYVIRKMWKRDHPDQI